MDTSVLRMQCWELWRLTRVEWMVRILLAIPFFWLYAVLPQASVIVFVAILMLSCTSVLWIGSLATDRLSGGFIFDAGYARPINVVQLVAVPMMWHVLSSALIYLLLTGFAAMVLGANFPLLHIVPSVSLCAVALVVAAWSTTNVVERVVAIFLAIGLGVGWFSLVLDSLDYFYAARTVRNAPFFRYAAPQIGLLFTCLALAGLGVVLIRRQRSGAYRPIFRIRRRAGESVLRHQGPIQRFKSSRQALLWFEAGRAGKRAVTIAAVGLSVQFLGMLGGLVLDSEVVFAFLWGAALVLTPLALLFVTNESVLGLKYRGSASSLSVFDATKPNAIGESILVKLLVSGGSLAGGMIVVGAMALVCALSTMHGPWGDIVDVAKVVWSWPLLNQLLLGFAVIAGLVAFVALCATAVLLLMSFGYFVPRAEEHTAAVNTIVGLLMFTVALVFADHLSSWQLGWLLRSSLAAWGGFLIVAAIVSLWRCARKGYYPRYLLVVTLGAWAGLVSVALLLLHGFAPELPPMPLSGVVLIVGLLCVPPASLAWAPLSLAALRSR